MLTTQTHNRQLGTLKPLFDIVPNADFNCSSNSERSVQKYMFYKCGHISGPKRSPDMTKTAGYLPGPKN